MRLARQLAFAVLTTLSICAQAQITPTRASIERQSQELKAWFALQQKEEHKSNKWTDAEVFLKAVEWALRYDEPLTDADLQLLQRTIDRGRERIKAIDEGHPTWNDKRGKLTRGYVSDIDSSIQPYGLIVPQAYDSTKPIRLDVVLHGSTRPVGIFEARFMRSFDEGDSGGSAPDVAYIELHPSGRVENCYRWAGETDVFEAIEDVCRHYKIDRSRIVLRGMSMGASGTWHLGLKHPGFFAALGPYCGYVDTHQFSDTPGMNFVHVGPLPDYQEKTLHMLDSVDYAANGQMIPAIAAMGEKDVFFQAHEIMRAAYEKEGVPFVNLISPGTGHVQEPVTWGKQMSQIAGHIEGPRIEPDFVRFTTWTLKYSKCRWVQILGLKEHYQQAEIRARRESGGSVVVESAKNITRFALLQPAIGRDGGSVTVLGQTLRIPKSSNPSGTVFELRDNRWVFAGRLDQVRLSGKKPGLQGPIDDAFTRKFLCVRGTGKPWNAQIGAWADANLKRFQYEYARYFRGDAPVKDDKDVTAEDRKTCNLILFGDPGSNRIIREALPKLPLKWSRETLTMCDSLEPSSTNAPSFIAPSPWSRDHYVVINSGHTFHETELNRLNYLLFPRHGDWAIMVIGAGPMPSNPSDPLPEGLVRAGFFDEEWKFPATVYP